MTCAESLTYLSLKACVWTGFGAKLSRTDSISNRLEGIEMLIVRGSP